MNDVTLWPWQGKLVKGIRSALRHYRAVGMIAPTGGGKCLGRGERVLMFDGSTRAVENIRVGDQLMGPDSQPRTVLQLGVGFGPMVTVRPKKGRPWRCNDDHVLTLVRTNEKSNPQHPSEKLAGQVVDVSVKEWRAWPKWHKHIYKLCRVGVHFPPQVDPLPIEPYFLGLLIGDGNLAARSTSVSTADAEIHAELVAQAEKWGLKLREEPDTGSRSFSYYFTMGRVGGKRNPLTQAIRKLNLNELSGQKFIPSAYKRASVPERLELLAGLMDTDGSLGRTGYDFVSKSRVLAHDVAFVARSLGFAAYVRAKVIPEGVYWRISINGDTTEIPVRVPRKVSPPRRQKKNVLRTGFDIIEEPDEDEFFGFTLDSDGRFLLEDFTVTHNTVMAAKMSLEIYRQVGEQSGSCLYLVHRKELLSQTAETLESIGLGDAYGFIAAGRPAKPWVPMHIASIPTIVNRLDSLDWLNPVVIFVDEGHHATAYTWAKIIDAYPNAFVIFMTATPMRNDDSGLGDMIDVLVLGPQIKEIAPDYLAPVQTFAVPPSFNMTKATLKAQAAQQTSAVIGKTVDNWQRLRPDGKTIFFAVDIEHSLEIVATLRARGVTAEHVDYKTPSSQRDRIFADMKAGRVQCVSNVKLFTEGTDWKECDTVVMARNTGSLVDFRQMNGRMMRWKPNGRHGTLIDTAGNIYMHGMPDDDIEWELEYGVDLKKQRQEASKYTTCEMCAFVYPNTDPVCPLCGTAPLKPAVLEVDVKAGAVTDLPPRPNGGSKPTKRQLSAEIVATGGDLGELEKLRRKYGYKRNWAQRMVQIYRFAWSKEERANG